LDFIHLVQYPSHDGRTLQYAQEALDSWHANRAYFKEKEVRDHFNIPKFHSLLHYIPSIKLKGTTDNGNTEAFEHLHITFAKDGWRASNKRDAFPQMITWLSRQEKVASYDFFRQWKSRTELEEGGLEDDVEDDAMPVTDPGEAEVVVALDNLKKKFGVRLAKRAPEPNKTLEKISCDHNAPMFVDALKHFINGLRKEPLPRKKLLTTPLPFARLDVWHQVKIAPSGLFEDEELSETVKAVPIWRRSDISRFDTVIVLQDEQAESTGVAGKKTCVTMSLPSFLHFLFRMSRWSYSSNLLPSGSCRSELAPSTITSRLESLHGTASCICRVVLTIQGS